MKIEHQQTCDKTEREAANLGLFSRSKSGREPEYNGFSTAGRLPLPAPWPALQTQLENHCCKHGGTVVKPRCAGVPHRPDVLDLCFAYVQRTAIAQSKQPISGQKSVLRDVISMAGKKVATLV
ncbi:hypothetical protein RRG08_044208 [Elysia crispata]|uniref:Uncharacterized protein n=1 Tax=Elysia crispata TaxID=231223 RepID=A0AAE1CNS5_9GAST|nr:hypothetical protein RRG08_044208 [Elysia crispata]